ncbi:hypothetical protein WJX72_012123 [[Myrmecia] bisecta]|uniref:Ubiquitin-like protease family profile domain-containing protein n=1 Tax=[Myrmecia] bisecta TaxID=41462 RepID=A0AAW1Q7X1_9CHLO
MLDVFQELAEEAHKQPSTLEGLANIVDAPPQYAFTQQELDNKFRGTSNADLRNKISQLETNLAKGALKFRDNGDKLRKLLEMHKQELERRAACSPGTTGWAHRAKHEQRWVNQYGVPEPTPSVPEPKPNPRVREANPSAVLDAYGSLDNSDDDFQPSRADQRRTGPTAAVPRMTKNGSSRAQGMVALSANGGTGSGTGKRRGGVPGLDAARAATHRLGGMHNGLGASQRFPGKPQLLLPGRLTLQRSTRSNDEKVDCTGCDKKGLIKAETYQGDGGIFLCRTCAADQFDVPPSGQLDCDTRHITAPQLKRSGAAPRSTGDFYGQANGAPAVKPGGAGRRAGRPAASRAAGRAKPKEDSTVIEISDDDEPGSGSGSGDVTASDREAVGGPPPRRSHRIGQHRTTTQRFEGLKALYPKEGGLTSVEITGGDMIRLDPEEFLNDTIIDFYIKFVQDEICKLPGGEAILDQCYFFNSFFYKKLTEKSGDGPKKGPAWNQANHARVKKWTKDQDIFSKRFLFVPIHEALHWSLFVICNPGLVAPTAEDSPCMLHLDSMGGCHPTVTIATNLLSYLQLEWQRKIEEGKAGGARSTAFEWAEAEEAVGASAVREFSKATFLHKRLPVPQQDNHCDCGLFLLAYLHYFLHSLPAHIHVNTADKLQDTHAYPNFLGQDWFQAGNASRLRQHIRHVIFRLFADQCRGRAELADALGEVDAEVDSFKALLASGGPTFVPPQDYRYQGEEAQRERIKREQAAAQRKAEQEAAKAAKKAELDAAKAEKKAAERVANGERKKRRREEAGRDRSPQEEDIFVELSSQEQGDTPPQRPTKQLRASLEGGARPLTQAAPRMDSVDLTDGAAEGGSRGDAAGDGSLERDPDFETAPDACALTDSDVEDDEQGGMAALGKRRSGRKRRSTEKAKEAVAAGDLTGGGAGQEEAGNDLAAAKKRRKKWRVLDDERLPGGEQEEAAQQDNGDVRFVAERRASLAGATTTSATAIVRGRILEHARGRFEKARRADLQVAPIGLPPKYDAHFTLLRMEGGAPHVQIWSHADVGTCEDLSTQRPAATFDTPEQAMAWLDRHCGAQAPRQGQPAGSPLDVEECHDLTGADDMEVPDSQPDGVGAAGMESELRDTHPSAAAAANAEPEVPEGWDQWRPAQQLFVEAAHPPQAGDQQQRQEAAPAFRRPAKDPGAIPGFRDTSSEEDEDGRVQHAAGSSAPKEHKHRAKRSAGDHAADALDLTGSAPADGLCSGHGTVIECRGVSGGEANPLGDATTTPGHQQELDDALLARRLQEQEDLAASAQRGFTSGPADSKPTRTLKAGQASSPGKQAKQRRKSKPETLPDPTQRTLHGFLGPSS